MHIHHTYCIIVYYIVLYYMIHTCIYHCQLRLCGPQFKGASQQEASGQATPLAVRTPAPTPQPHGPLVQRGYSSVGLRDPTQILIHAHCPWCVIDLVVTSKTVKFISGHHGHSGARAMHHRANTDACTFLSLCVLCNPCYSRWCYGQILAIAPQSMYGGE